MIRLPESEPRWSTFPRLAAVTLLGIVAALCLLPDGSSSGAAILPGLTAVLCILAAGSLTRVALPSPWLIWPCLVYGAAVTLSVWSAAPGVDPQALTQTLWFIAVALATSIVASEARVRSAVVAAVIVGLALLMPGAAGPRSNPDPFGRFLFYPAISHWGAYPEIGLLAMMGLGAVLALALATRTWRLRGAALCLGGLFAVVPVFVISRAATAGSVALIGWLTIVAAAKWRERLVVGALIGACLIGGPLVWFAIDRGRPTTAYSDTPAGRAVVERAAHWNAAVAMIRAHPWTGVGPGRFASEFPRTAQGVEPMRHAHNMLLNVAAETGLIALVAFLVLWGWVLAGTLRASALDRPGTVAFAIHGMLMAFFLRSTTDQFLSNVHSSFRTSLFVGLLLGLADAAIRARDQVPKAPAAP